MQIYNEAIYHKMHHVICEEMIKAISETKYAAGSKHFIRNIQVYTRQCMKHIQSNIQGSTQGSI